MIITLDRPDEETSYSSLESLSVKKVAARPEKKGPRLNTLDTLVPVQLPPVEMDKFVKAFHTPKALKPTKAFFDEARFMIEVSAYINCIFAGLRYGMWQALYNAPANADLGDLVSKEIATQYANSVELEAKTKDFMMAMASGRHHIIRDSIRYKGGKDILYVGLRGANVSPLLTSGHAVNVPLPIVTASNAYNEAKEVYESKIGTALVATGNAIQKMLLGEPAALLASAYTRIYASHPISGNGTKFVNDLQKIFMSGPLAKLGVPVILPPFKGEQTTHSVERMSEYTSLMILREPNHVIVQQKARSEGVPDESLEICTEALALQPDLRMSFAVSIPQNFCEYITQTKGEQIPLVPLNTWATVWSAAMLRPPKARSGVKAQRGQGQRVLTPERAPKYVLRPSMSVELQARRKALGLYSEKGRVNEDGLMIKYNGDLACMNASTDAAAITAHAKEYEKNIEEALTISFEAGTPLAAGHKGSTGLIFDIASPRYAQKISALKGNLEKFKGTAQAINWDMNSVISVSEGEPDRLVSSSLVGNNCPNELNIAVYMRSPMSAGMRDMFSSSVMINEATNERNQMSVESFKDVARGIKHSTIFYNFARLYGHMLGLKKVPDLKTLVDSAAKELKIQTLGDELVMDYELMPFDTNQTIYKDVVRKDLSVPSMGSNTGQAVVALLGVSAQQASAASGTNLARVCIRDNIEFSEHPRYFDGSVSSVGEFGNLFQYLGGQVFRQAALALLAIPRKEFLSTATQNTSQSTDDAPPSFTKISEEVLPMCVVLVKYTTPTIRDAIYKKADELKAANTEVKFGEDDLNLAGSRPPGPGDRKGMQLFPHQAVALSRLKSHPKIAILDIAPGGGKTTIGIADIAMSYADGIIKRPFIFCPNRLVRNWVEDCHKSFNGWNVIPVTTTSYAEWGEERLTELILKAPPNTIVVVGNSFLSHGAKTQLVIGNAVEKLSNSVEFCKKFEPDYVLIDESHRIRNPRSAIHNGIKAIMMMSSVKLGRIATGTLIQNVMSDVVGQSAVFNGQIFRTKEEFDRTNKGVIGQDSEGNDIIDYKGDVPMKARRRMGEFATVISFKRKEWAFMLPIPIETFIPVNMEEIPKDASGSTSKKPEDVQAAEDGHKLRMFYDAVLRITLDEAKNDPKIKKDKSGGDDDDDDDGEDDDEGDDNKAAKGKKGKSGPRTITTPSGTQIEVSEEDDDSDSTDDLEAALQPYLARLERLLTDPFGDPDLAEVADFHFGKDFDKESYVSPKVRKVIDRLKLHFTEIPWVKGKEYKASDMCDYNGKSYIFKAELGAGEGKEASNHAPDTDTKLWLPQIRGKVFVTCRYTRSVDAIYRALPKDLQARCVKFHGEISGKDGTKDGNINRFMKDPKIDIMVANEMGISEGHNFQMASRFIRVEAPWAPGELDQTAARIFRPDVGGAFARQTIFLDWILCDGTLEVAKMGRLISKMLKRTKFDELDNPKYFKELNPLNLPIIKMSLDNIRNLYKIDDLCEVAGEGSSTDIHEHSYIGQYAYLAQETGDEFKEMRKTKRAYMLDVKPTPMPASAKLLDYTPWVPNMPVIDKDNEGLVALTTALEEDSELAAAFKINAKALIGQYVRTEFGLGVITGVRTKKGQSTADENATDEEQKGNEVSSVVVQFSQGGAVERLDPSKVFLALKITERNKDKDNKKAPKITEADKKRTEKARLRGLKEDARARARAAREKALIKAQLSKAKAKAPVAKVKPVEPEEDEAYHIELFPVIYNEFLALKAANETPEESKALKRFGFRSFGDYAFIPVKTYQAFTAILEFLEKSYTLSPKTVQYLDSLHDSFASGRGRKFQVELAPLSDLPLFYRTRHILTKVVNRRKPELKLYPIIASGNLALVVDLDTNPVFRKQLNKAIPGANAKFEDDVGMDICFFKNKSELVAKVRELRQAGFVIDNLDELKEATASLSLKAALTNK